MVEPDPKKRKIEDTSVFEDEKKFIDDKTEIEKVIGMMKKSQKNLQPILDDNFTTDLPTIQVYVGTIKEKKAIFQVIISLNNLLPLPDLQHLKRARNTEIIICPSNVSSPEDVFSNLKDKGFDLQAYLEGNFKIVAVTSKPPLLKSQYEKAHKIWPCNFHPNKYNEKLVSGDFFSRSELEKHKKYMALAYEVAEIYEDADHKFDEASQNSEADSENNSKDELDKDLRIRRTLSGLRGVLVVDPEIDSIVAVGYDRRIMHPCQHPVMVAIDNVAKSQNGGAWNDFIMFTEELPKSPDEELVVEGVPRMFRNILNTSHDGLRFGARKTMRRNEISKEQNSFGKKLAKIDDVTKSLEQKENKEDVKSNSKSIVSPMCISSESLFNEEPSGKPSGPYLCTGYDVYTTNEPCIMCSMALVHSRAKRVMFGLKNTNDGALASRSKLHTVSALNHRYEVFTGFFDESLS